MCSKCEAYNGLWMETPEGLRRCTCASGRKLSQPITRHQPVITVEQARVFVEMLAVIPFYPGEAGARVMIGDELRELCESPEKALWLVKRMARLFPNRWPGLGAMRHVYASSFIPWDGVMPQGICEHYPEGIPTEAEEDDARQIEGAKPKQIEAGKVSVDERLNRVMEIASALQRVKNAPMKGSATPEEIAAAPDWLRKLEGYE